MITKDGCWQCSQCLRWFSSQAELNSHHTALTKPCKRYDLEAWAYWRREKP